MTGHWSDAYFGDLYLDSVEDLLTPRLTAIEADAIAALLRLVPGDRVLDLACGHGRHAWALAGRVRWMYGVDRSAAYLGRAVAGGAATEPRARRRARARPRSGAGTFTGSARASSAATPGIPSFTRGDVRALPFRAGAFDAAYAWYSSLFMFDDPTNAAVLAEAARVVRTGGRLLVQHANPARLALAPRDAARRALADGSIVEETSEFDAASGVDRCARRLVRPSGAVLAATAELRYYRPSDWIPLARRAGLRVAEITTTPLAGRTPVGEIGPEAPDLVVVLEKSP